MAPPPHQVHSKTFIVWPSNRTFSKLTGSVKFEFHDAWISFYSKIRKVISLLLVRSCRASSYKNPSCIHDLSYCVIYTASFKSKRSSHYEKSRKIPLIRPLPLPPYRSISLVIENTFRLYKSPILVALN